MSYVNEFVTARIKELLTAPGSDFRSVTAERKDATTFTKITSASHTRAALKPEVSKKGHEIAERTKAANPHLIRLATPDKKWFTVDVNKIHRIAAQGKVWDLVDGRLIRNDNPNATA